MTVTESMDNVAAFLRDIVKNYNGDAKEDWMRAPIEVYAGFPPVRESRDAMPSCVYCVVTDVADEANDSAVEMQIGFSVYDKNPTGCGRSLYNLIEHVRQGLLKHRTVAGRNRLILPLKTEIPTEQPFPEWVGVITAKYAIAFIEEEGIDYDETFDNI